MSDQPQEDGTAQEQLATQIRELSSMKRSSERSTLSDAAGTGARNAVPKGGGAKERALPLKLRFVAWWKGYDPKEYRIWLNSKRCGKPE